MYAGMAGPPIVVFQDLDRPVMSAIFGEVMCTTYTEFGAVGLITSGVAGDLDHVEAMSFLRFPDGAICALGYCHILQIAVLVHVGGICVMLGQHLHGDRNGVAAIPHELASEVAHASAELVAAEQIVFDYLKSPNINPKGCAEVRKECKNHIDGLAKRLKR